MTAKKIVLTGGPCAGKSTVQTILSDVLADRGWKVFRVPETATVLLSGGVIFSDLSSEQAFQFQKDLVKVMMSIEDTYFNLAAAEVLKGNNVAVICDRGVMDASAYLEKTDWQRILKDLNLNEIEVRDQRYDCVVHLISAADGAEEFYNMGTNHTRSEGIEHAKHLDELCKKAWVGHPYFDVVDNSSGFDLKCNRVIGCILSRLGLPDTRFSNDIKKFKFLAPESFSVNIPVAHQEFEVEHTFLAVKNGNQSRIRRRTQDGVSHFNITSKKIGSRDSVELRRSLTGREYEDLLQQADLTRTSILKRRKCFIFKNKTFQLDLFLNTTLKDVVLLEALLPEKWDKDDLPPFIKTTQDITNLKEYSLSEISLIKNL